MLCLAAYGRTNLGVEQLRVKGILRPALWGLFYAFYFTDTLWPRASFTCSPCHFGDFVVVKLGYVALGQESTHAMRRVLF